jgi:NAD(P)-dependent dehydrogenase (short-subunit alcohol dehydrogenase family)
MDLGLDGRVALVTGGSRGIGFAVARRLLDEGARVAICGRDDAAGRAAADRLGGDVAWSRADVSVDDDVKVLVEGVVARWGRLDVVVNNAGRFTGGPLHEIPDHAWLEGFDIKTVGAERLVRHARDALVASGQGRVVNVSGVTANLVVPGVAVTAVTNAAMIALTAYQAQDLRAHGITVNCVVPGYTRSEVWQGRIEAYAAEHGLSAEAAESAVLRDRGFGTDARWGEVDELASVIAFLVSGPASYVNGATLRVDGAQLQNISAP